MSRRTRYQREYFLTKPDGIVIRVGFNSDRGRVTGFTIQLECWLDGRWRPAVRYDTAHDRAHRDTLGWTGGVENKDWLPVEIDYNEAMSEAIRDLTAHAQTYRDEFLRRKPR